MAVAGILKIVYLYRKAIKLMQEIKAVNMNCFWRLQYQIYLHYVSYLSFSNLFTYTWLLSVNKQILICQQNIQHSDHLIPERLISSTRFQDLVFIYLVDTYLIRPFPGKLWPLHIADGLVHFLMF